MKKLLYALVFAIIVFGSFGFADNPPPEAPSATPSFALEIVHNWQVLSIMALIASSILVAIAYMIGIGFEMPEIKAWASNELVQVFANAIIIVALLVTIAFIDAVVLAVANTSGLPVACTVSKDCLQTITNSYLGDYVNTAESGAREVLKNNLASAGWANRRIGLTCLSIYCLQAGFTTTMVGQYVLDQDFYSIIFEYYTNLLSTMEAQKFFVNEIAFKMGPLILALGIVARTFFLTRKLGGLLMSIALGIMFFLPGMYIFDWMTLDAVHNGDKAVDSETVSCPAECSANPPVAYSDDGRVFNSSQDLIAAFSASTAASLATSLVDGSAGTQPGSNGSYNGHTITSCYYGESGNCPASCRELPYPSSSPNCRDLQNATYCSELPDQCKVRRYVQNIDQNEYGKCPASCRIVPPMRGNCNVKPDGSAGGNCLASRPDCRIAKRTDLNYRPDVPQGADDNQRALCNQASDCPANLSAEQSCVYVIPDSGNCNELCVGCPQKCRIQGADLSQLPDVCKDGSSLSAACNTCLNTYDSCTVNKSIIQSLNPPSDQCGSCIPEKRILFSDDVTDDYVTGGCSINNCGKQYREVIPTTTCESCLFTVGSYIYDPPVNTECSDLCAPPNNAPQKTPGAYSATGGEGLVGKPEIQDVAKLMVPVYLLPLFNIVLTLAFIKGMSTILGGDIEIPGLSKVF